jgi:DNA polymerase-3 subunit beta
MQLTIPRSELKNAVTGLSRIIPNKTTLPILSAVRFDHNGCHSVAQATDLDQTARYHFTAAQATGDGAFIIPLQCLKELAKGNDRETVEFETASNGTINITNHVGGHTVKHPVAGMDVDEWPVSPDEVSTRPADGFLETYRRLVPFASSDITRYLLNGVFIDVAEKGEHPVTMVATDGRRLSLWNSMNLPVPMSAIVPTSKFLQWQGLEGKAEIGLRTQQVKKETIVRGIALRVGPWSYDVKAIEGQYPNFRQIIGSGTDDSIRITFTDEDVAALKKILPAFPGHDGQNEGIGLTPGPNGRLVISGRSADDRETTTLELTGGSRFEGKIRIGISRAFLLDALHAGFRTFTTNDEMSPLRSVDGRGGVHVLMPLRLGNEPVKQPEPPIDPAKDNAVVPEQTKNETPADVPVLKEKKPKGETMTEKSNENGTTEGTALDRVLASVETARAKLKETVTSLSEVADAVKVAVKEGKAQSGDLEKARVTLQKLQAISL